MKGCSSGGRFFMGSDLCYPDETPRRPVEVSPFSIERTPVTNAQFVRFVAATAHVTLAEIAPDPADHPGLKPEDAIAGSLGFHAQQCRRGHNFALQKVRQLV